MVAVSKRATFHNAAYANLKARAMHIKPQPQPQPSPAPPHPGRSTPSDEMTCLIVGDSIAVGLASALKGCIVAAKVGMGSAWIAAHTPGTIVDVAFISSGSNDPTNPDLSANLESTRTRLTAGRIVWIKPVNPHARGVVTAVAAAHGDKAVAFMPGRDNVHPKSYEALAREVNGGGS